MLKSEMSIEKCIYVLIKGEIDILKFKFNCGVKNKQCMNQKSYF